MYISTFQNHISFLQNTYLEAATSISRSFNKNISKLHQAYRGGFQTINAEASTNISGSFNKYISKLQQVYLEASTSISRRIHF